MLIFQLLKTRRSVISQIRIAMPSSVSLHIVNNIRDELDERSPAANSRARKHDLPFGGNERCLSLKGSPMA
jgi:hypothetical protein